MLRLARPAAWFAALLALGTYLLIIVGGLVHNTNSGMACPDWPFCYGLVFPELTGGVLYEHGHRYLATLTGCGVLLLAAYLWNKHSTDRAPVRAKFTLLGFFFVVAALVTVFITPLGQGNIGWDKDAGKWPGLIHLWHIERAAPWLVALLIAVLYAIIAATLRWRDPSTGERPLALKGIGLLMLILLQGLLGGTTVAFNLPSIVSTAHLATSMLVLLLMIYLAWELRRRGMQQRGALDPAWPPPGAAGVRGLLAVATLLVFVQIILGALVRHTLASWSAGVGWEHATIGQDPLSAKLTLWPATGRAELNVFHRYFALAVAGLLVWAAWRAWWALGPAVGDRLGRVMLIWLPVQLVALQILVGVAMLGMNMEITIRTLHLAIGTLLLAAQFVLALNALPPPPPTPAATSEGQPAGF